MIINSYIFDAPIPTKNLVLYNRFDGNLTDETGNHTLSSSGISYTNGIYSGVASEAVEFSSAKDYVRVPASDLLSFGDGTTDSPFSISVAVNLDNIGVVDSGSGVYSKVLLWKDGISSLNREYGLFVSNTTPNSYIQISLYDESTNGIIAVYGSTAVSNYTTYHVIATYDGSSSESGLKIYINGVEESYTSQSSGTYVAMENLSGVLQIGDNARIGNNLSIDGRMDELGIFNKELSQAEVTAIYNKISAGNSLL